MAGTSLERLAAAAARIDGIRGQLQSERERRDAAIVEAREAGHLWRDIAGAAMLSIGACAQILAQRP